MNEIYFFVKILSQGRRKEGQEFRSLGVQGKLIALKKGSNGGGKGQKKEKTT